MPQGAIAPLHRTTRIDELLIAQLRVLETLTPEGFLEFRDPLTPASGLQSGQFRAIEVLGGLEGAMPAGRGAAVRARPPGAAASCRQLRTLYQALCACLRAHGFDAPDGDDADAAASGASTRSRRCTAITRQRSVPSCTTCASCSSITTRRSRAGASITRRWPRARSGRVPAPAAARCRLPRDARSRCDSSPISGTCAAGCEPCSFLPTSTVTRAPPWTRADPLAGFRDRFLDDGSTIYLDGNSMGRLPKAAVPRLREMAEHEWGSDPRSRLDRVRVDGLAAARRRSYRRADRCGARRGARRRHARR